MWPDDEVVEVHASDDRVECLGGVLAKVPELRVAHLIQRRDEPEPRLEKPLRERFLQ
jgi:hypothetical protein